jgi:hypothetical protein
MFSETMAEITVGLVFSCSGGDQDAEAFRREIERDLGLPGAMKVDLEPEEAGRWLVTVTGRQRVREPEDARAAIVRIHNVLNDAWVGVSASLAQAWLRASMAHEDPAYLRLRPEFLSMWLLCPIPHPDLLLARVRAAPERAIRDAIAETMVFGEDRSAACKGIRVTVQGESLRLEAHDPNGQIARAATAFLNAAARPDSRLGNSPLDALATPRIAAAANVALALATVALSFASLSSLAIAGLLLAALSIAAGGGILARRVTAAAWRPVLVALAPMLTVVVFAALYALVAKGTPGAITHDGHHVRSLGDALLLSLNVALTGGIPDLTLTGTVRVAVYAEMLLFIGSVGFNVAAIARWSADYLGLLLGPGRPREQPEGPGPG